MKNSNPLLTVSDLRVSVGRVDILRGISFQLSRGERLGIVGESGSGKSITALSLMGLLKPPTKVSGGSIHLENVDLLGISRSEYDGIRGKRIAMIYQDPGSALNPLMPVGKQIVESIRLHEKVTVNQAMVKAADLLGEVGISNPQTRLLEYPHEFSGGMRQRVMIAMAMSCKPEILICDEPTTALDVTTQAKVMNLIDEMCREHNVASILITHDLGVAANFCDSIAVMYAGQIVEASTKENIFTQPLHPYSRALLDATLDLNSPTDIDLPAIPGSPPTPQDFDVACSFRSRCPHSVIACGSHPIPLAIKKKKVPTATLR